MVATSVGLDELAVERSITVSRAANNIPASCMHNQLLPTQDQPQPSEAASNEMDIQPTQAIPNAGSQWLLPFTDMFSKRRQFAVDCFGGVHLIVGELSAVWLALHSGSAPVA